MVVTPQWVNSSLPLTPEQDFDYRTHVLLQLTKQALRLVVVPDLEPLLRPSPPSPLASHLGAGRRRGQVSPRLDWLALDGSEAVFRLFERIKNRREKEAAGCELSHYLQEAGRSDYGLAWSWHWADLGSEPYP